MGSRRRLVTLVFGCLLSHIPIFFIFKLLRVSVDFYTGQAVSSMQQTVETLHQLWDDVSMEDHQRLDRVDGFYKIIKQLMDDVVSCDRYYDLFLKLCYIEALISVV